jgi:hypothetical protein
VFFVLDFGKWFVFSGFCVFVVVFFSTTSMALSRFKAGVKP